MVIIIGIGKQICKSLTEIRDEIIDKLLSDKVIE